MLISPRSSGDRAPPSGGGCAGSNPAGGTRFNEICRICERDYHSSYQNVLELNQIERDNTHLSAAYSFEAFKYVELQRSIIERDKAVVSHDGLAP